jgi:enamine deaminase RidA (YjgF/YER057c/UK114 family)
MTVLRHVVAPEGAPAGRGYSQVVTGRGRLVVVSGQVAQNVKGELVGPGDPAAQARQVFENLRRCLAEVGAASGKLVIASCCARHRISVTIGA